MANYKNYMKTQGAEDLESVETREVSSSPLGPINRLPLELIERIIDNMRDPYPSPTPLTSEPAADDMHGWIRSATHVCSVWRSLARQRPALWCDITFPFHGFVKASTFLQLSQGLPLCVRGHVSLEDYPDLTLTLKNLPRIYSLDIFIPRAGRASIAGAFRAYSAPLLSTLAIGPYWDERGINMDDEGGPAHLFELFPLNHVAQHSPGPQSLSLSYCGFRPLNVYLGSLTSLCLDTIPAPLRLSLEDLLSLLAQTPLLQTLELRDEVMDIEGVSQWQEMEARPPVELQHILSIFVHHYFTISKFIVDHVFCPLAPFLYLRSEMIKEQTHFGLPNSAEMAALLREHLSNHVTNGRPVRMLFLQLHRQSKDVFTMDIGGSASTEPTTDNDLFRVRAEWWGIDPDYRFFVELCRSIDVAEVRGIWLGQVNLSSPHQWLDLLAHWHKVRVLEINVVDPLLCHVLRASLPGQDEHNRVQAQIMCLPALRVLKLEISNLEEPIAMDDLVAYLLARRTGGYPLEELHMEASHRFPPDDIASLIEKGKKMFWSSVNHVSFEWV